MARTFEDQTLALAGVVQACVLSRELAYQGQAPEAAYAASIDSIFTLDAPDVPSIYGGAMRLGEGLRHLRKQLTGQTGNQDAEITRRAITLLHLAGTLMNTPEMITTLQRGIQAADSRRQAFGAHSPEVIEDLARIYQQTISTLSPKVMVNGDPHQLNRPEVAQRIRAVLLAGIRSAVLWHQCGGSKWNLLFRRKRFLEAAERLLRSGLHVVS